MSDFEQLRVITNTFGTIVPPEFIKGGKIKSFGNNSITGKYYQSLMLMLSFYFFRLGSSFQ